MGVASGSGGTVRLLAEHGPGAAMGAVMRAQLGECPHKDSAQLQHRCDPYCPDLARLFVQTKTG